MRGAKPKSSSLYFWNRAAGFTLIEVMIVLAISSLLAVVLLNYYTQSQRRARFSDGIEKLVAGLETIKNEVNSSYTGITLNNDPTREFFGKAVSFTVTAACPPNAASTYSVQPLTVPNNSDDTLSAPIQAVGTALSPTLAWQINLCSTTNANTDTKVVFTRNTTDGLLNTYILKSSDSITDDTKYCSGCLADTAAATLTFSDPTGLSATVTINASTNAITYQYTN